MILASKPKLRLGLAERHLRRTTVHARSFRGHLFSYVTYMPRIADEHLDNVVYLYPTAEDARTGEHAGGTGFVVGVPMETPDTNMFFPYVVTAHHVVNRHEGNSPVIRLNTRVGEFDVFDVAHAAWISHPDGDDIAICDVGLEPADHRFVPIPTSSFVGKEEIAGSPYVGIGDEVFTVSRFLAHEGRERNLPSVRFGSISMMPSEPVLHPTRGIKQEAYLIESRSIAGVSGAPVFVLIPPFSPRPDFRMDDRLTVRFLGIDIGHLASYTRVLEEDDSRTKLPVSPAQWVKEHSGMSIVVPAWKVLELLYAEELVEERRASEAAWLEAHRGHCP